MSQKIHFYPKTKEIELNVPAPKPAKAFFPEWYKKIPKFENNEFKINVLGDGKVQANTTVKSCMPFLDTFTTGYIQHTWCDVLIEYRESDGYVSYKYAGEPEIMNVRSKVSSEALIQNNEFYPVEFVWHQPWIPKMPKGYSLLYTHPINRTDLPFYSLSGIIDNDVYTNETAGNHPFFIKKGFTGLIPAGTPMFQLVPIKRESWTHEVHEMEPFNEIKRTGVQQYFYDGYKRLFWNKKEYN
jgi:hypothetical protein